MSLEAPESLTGDQIDQNSILGRAYQSAKQAGALRGKEGQDFMLHRKTGLFAIGHGVDPGMALMKRLRLMVEAGRLSKKEAEGGFEICEVGPDDLMGLVPREVYTEKARMILQELKASGFLEELPLRVGVYIHGPSGLFQVESPEAVLRLAERVVDWLCREKEKKDKKAEKQKKPIPNMYFLPEDIAPQIEYAPPRREKKRKADEISARVRLGVFDLLTGKVTVGE